MYNIYLNVKEYVFFTPLVIVQGMNKMQMGLANHFVTAHKMKHVAFTPKDYNSVDKTQTTLPHVVEYDAAKVHIYAIIILSLIGVFTNTPTITIIKLASAMKRLPIIGLFLLSSKNKSDTLKTILTA